MTIKDYIVKFKEFLAHEHLHAQWLKELSTESRTKSFNRALKRKVKDRDNWECQECRIKSRQLRQMSSYLTVHHINFNHEDCQMSNLITLCPLCHAKTNFQKDSWIKYYSEKIELVHAKKETRYEEKSLPVDEKKQKRGTRKCGSKQK